MQISPAINRETDALKEKVGLTPKKMISELAARSAAPPSKALPYTRKPRARRALCLSKLRTLAEICSTDDTPDLQKPFINASPICTSVGAFLPLVSGAEKHVYSNHRLYANMHRHTKLQQHLASSDEANPVR